MKKAFTLIELLVVIAIIAILAAILFPVFAQAKEAAKKTTDLSNMKQIGTATQVYLSDSDDVYPVSVPVSNGVNQESFWTTPADRVAGNVDLRNSFWMNAIYPYVKSWAIYRNSTPDWNYFNINNATDNKQNFASSYNPNTYLNSYNATGVNSPSTTILYWQALGKASMQGYTSSYPPIGAGSLTAPFHFGRGTGQCPTFYIWGIEKDERVFTGGHNLVYTDTNAHFVKTPSGRSPWAALTTDGLPSSIWIDTTGGCTVYYWHAPDIDR